MKYFNLHGPSKLRILGFIAAGLMLGLSSISAWAVPIGTPSGTTVSNLATVNYSVGGVAQTAIGSTVAGNTRGAGVATTFLVDSKVNLTVAEGNATFTSVVPGQTGAATTFTVTNTSNTTLDFSLAAANVASGQVLFAGTDNFDATACATFLDTNANGVYDSGTDLAAAFIDELISGNSATVFVVCNIPGTQVNNDNAIVSLVATAQGTFTGANNTYVATPAALGAAITQTAGANTANVDQVFADIAGSDDAARDAKHSARDEFRVVSATISVTKTATPLCDPFNNTTNPKEIPGGVVRWTITIANTGGASASLTTIADTLNANTAFDPDLIATTSVVCEFAAGGAGTPENAVGRGFRVQNTVARPMLGSPGGTTLSSYFTTAADADGFDAVAAALTMNLGTALPAGGAYTAGELKAGETLTIYFNAGIN